jgi:outer membrane lipase/esterase
MSRNWSRRAVLAVACVSAVLVAACGSGTIESQLSPTRIVTFGDAVADLGQRGTRYTVNDATVNVWTQQVAGGFNLPLNNASTGGKSYATGNARVAQKPDAAGNTATLTVTGQIDTFLASDAVGGNDLVILSAGTADVVAEVARALAGTQTGDQAIANARQAGRDLGAQVKRLVNAGSKYVVVAGPYNLGRTPWAIQTGQAGLMETASSKFNEELLVSIVDLGANVLYVDAALHYNLVTSVPANYNLRDATSIACTSVDPGPGIGTGNNQVNSSLCTPSTITGAVDYNTYVWADRVYSTPQAQRLFGDYAFSRIRARW